MNIVLSKNHSENTTIGKSITQIASIEANVKNAISIYKPVVILSYDNDIYDVNYAYISEYGRYYFVENKTLLTGNRYELILRCDVLESFKNDIKNLRCIIDKQELTSLSNMYLNDGSFIVQNNEFNTIINFSNGFNENGDFVLICAGG